MTFKDRYLRNKQLLLEDPTFNPNNKKVVEDFLTFVECKLKRKQGLTEVDERSYKTSSHYITRIKNLTNWLNNKTWADLTEEEIKKLIDDMEDGVIKNKKGKRHEDRSLYYLLRYRNKNYCPPNNLLNHLKNLCHKPLLTHLLSMQRFVEHSKLLSQDESAFN